MPVYQPPRPIGASVDRTTMHSRRGWARRQNNEGGSSADPRTGIVQLTETEKRVLLAFKQELSDYATRKLSSLLQQSQIKSLLAELRLPHSKVLHLLKLHPLEFICHEDPRGGQAYICLKRPKDENDGGSAVPNVPASRNREPSTSRPSSSSQRQTSGISPPGVPANGNRQSASAPRSSVPAPAPTTQSNLFHPMTSSEDEDAAPAASTSKSAAAASHKPDRSGQQGEPALGIQRPQDQQSLAKQMVAASPRGKDRFKRFEPRQLPTSRGNSRTRTAQSDDEEEEELLRAIRESMSAAPPAHSRHTATYDARRASTSANTLDHYDQNGFENVDNDERRARPPSEAEAEGGADTTMQGIDPMYGEELFSADAAVQARQEEAGHISLDEDEEDANDGKRNRSNSYSRRSMSRRAHTRTSSGTGSQKKELPAMLVDGYQATRSRGRVAQPGPPGLQESSTRDSSIQDDSAPDDTELDEVKPVIKRGPTRPGTVRPRSTDEADDSDDDDVIEVTSVRLGGPPSKSAEEREAERAARLAEKQERRAEKEAKRAELARRSERRRRNPLPHFRHTSDQEHAELMQLYEAYLKQKKASVGTGMDASPEVTMSLEKDAPSVTETLLQQVSTHAREDARWTEVYSHQTPKGTGDFNTVKFWPYNLPFPGRKQDEAIVAIAGGQTVRVLRLSEKRGVSELWNAIDESANWELGEHQENLHTCAWTYEMRHRDASIAPQWRKWPILCVAGHAKEVKILDGYSGTTLKIIQGHGGPIYSIAVHPTLPHVIATASGDESVALWDISVPVARPEVVGITASVEEGPKRRKGYAEGERLCSFAGFNGHVEAILSIAFHPTLPFLASGGGDCRLRIWRLPDDLPSEATGSLTRPKAVNPPEKSVRPPSYAFPVFTQASLHSHHIDHVSWVGSEHHLLTRSLCFDAPGKRVIRLFKPKFFDTLADELAVAPDNAGFIIDYPPAVELVARFTVPSCSDNVGDGVVNAVSELTVGSDGKLACQWRLYLPSLEPVVHVYNLDPATKQANLDELVRSYPMQLGSEMLFQEEASKDSQLRAIDCQTAGNRWLVAVGESEKITIWQKRLGPEEWEVIGSLDGLLRRMGVSRGQPMETYEPAPVPNEHRSPFEVQMVSPEVPEQSATLAHVAVNGAASDVSMQEDLEVSATGLGSSVVTNGPSHMPPTPEPEADPIPAVLGEVTRSPSVEYV